MTSSWSARTTGVQKRFGLVEALAGIDWTIAPGVCSGLVGSSGSGKTTLLRIVAGLDEPDAGSVQFAIAGESAAAHRPTIGMVFQNLGLWPHLTARQHVECVLNQARSERRTAAESLLNEVHLPRPAWDRPPGQLSGGEGQRVALARALACDPQLLLLDEPLAHLDAVLRTELLEQLAELIRRRGLTTVYVTHAWQEAALLCQNIAVLKQGRLQQQGSPEGLYWTPANAVVARLTGPIVTLPRAWVAEGKIAVDSQSPHWPGLIADSGDALWLRPQQVRLIAPSGANRWRVAACQPLGASWQIELEGSSGERLALPTGALVASGECVGLELSPLHAPGEGNDGGH